MRKGYIVLVISFLVLTFPLVLKSDVNTYDSHDERVHHYATVQQFLGQFPGIDLSDYPSATTPLFHLLMVFSAKAFGLNLVGLRILNMLLSLACVLVVYRYLAVILNPDRAVLFAICFMLSSYFIGPSVRLATDNAGLLAVFATMMLLDRAGPVSSPRFLAACLVATLGVLTRQIHIWLVAAMLFVTWRDPDIGRGRRVAHGLASLIPAAVLVPFVVLWGGLTPPSLRATHQSSMINPDALIGGMAVLGFFGLFFFPWQIRSFRDHGGRAGHIAAIVVVAVAFLFTYSRVHPLEAGTWGGALWSASRRLPDVVGVPVLFWVLFPLGLCVIYLAIRCARSTGDYFLAVCALTWLAVSLSSVRVYQKYYEPFWLFFLAYTTRYVRPAPRLGWAGVVLLVVGLFIIDVFRFFWSVNPVSP